MANRKKHTLSKPERLNSKLAIEKMFMGGNSKSFSIFPLRTVVTPIETGGDSVACILISVSKKRFKRAVKRNRVKRQIREAYRKNKHELLQALALKGQKLAIAFIYLADELRSSAEIEKKMKKALSSIMERMA